MADAQLRNSVEDALALFERRARANGHSFDQEVELLLQRAEKFTAEERVAVSTYFHSRCNGVQPSLTLEEIREGLM